MFYSIGEVFTPLLLHILISNITAAVFGGWLDAAFLTALAAAFTLPFLIWMYEKDKKRNPKEKAVVSWWVYLLMAALGVALNKALSGLLDYFAVTEHFSNAAQEGLLRSGMAAQVLGLGILAPVAEEYLFRGLFYQRLKNYVPVWMAVLLGAAAFALYHGNMVQALFAFPMGIVMLLAYEKWNVLAVPIVFHMAVNISTVTSFAIPSLHLFKMGV